MNYKYYVYFMLFRVLQVIHERGIYLIFSFDLGGNYLLGHGDIYPSYSYRLKYIFLCYFILLTLVRSIFCIKFSYVYDISRYLSFRRIMLILQNFTSANWIQQSWKPSTISVRLDFLKCVQVFIFFKKCVQIFSSLYRWWLLRLKSRHTFRFSF